MNWKEMKPGHKILLVISCIGVLLVVLLRAKPDLFPVDPTYPAIVVVTLCEAVIHWKEKRKWSYLLIAGAVISGVCFLLDH